MNINSSIHNLRYAAPQKLEKNIVEDIKDEVIEEVQSQPLQEQNVEQGYGNASSQQYLANMGIQIVSTSRTPVPPKAQPQENPVAEKQVEANTTQIANSRTSELKDNAGTTPKSEAKVVSSVPHTPVATVATTVASSGSSVGEDLYQATGEAIQEFLRKEATSGALINSINNIEQMEQLGKLCLEDPLYMNKMIEEYLAVWDSAHDVSEFSSEVERGTAFIKDLCSEKLGLNLANLAKCAGGAAIASLLVKIGVSTVIDVAPDIGKDVLKLGKKTFKNLFKLNIGGLVKNTMIDAPVLVIRNMGRSVRALAKNTYQTAKGIIVAGVKGAYDTVSTAVKGTVETISKPIGGVIEGVSRVGKGIVGSVEKVLKGDVIGGTLKLVGGVAEGVGNVVKGVVGGVVSGVKTVAKTVGKALNTVGNVVGEVLGNPVKAVGKAVKSVGKAIGKLFKGW